MNKIICLESLFLLAEVVVDVVLHQDGDHSVRSHSEVESGKTHPQTQEALVFDSLQKTVNNVFVGQHALII